jgi:hypothetical protein
MSPSLSKTMFSSSILTDDNTLTPFNNHSKESTYTPHTSFNGKILSQKTID